MPGSRPGHDARVIDNATWYKTKNRRRSTCPACNRGGHEAKRLSADFQRLSLALLPPLAAGWPVLRSRARTFDTYDGSLRTAPQRLGLSSRSLPTPALADPPHRAVLAVCSPPTPEHAGSI